MTILKPSCSVWLNWQALKSVGDGDIVDVLPFRLPDDIRPKSDNYCK